MTVDNDMKAEKVRVQLGMAAVNAASLPFRSFNVVVGGLVQLAASSHPAAKEAIGKVGQMIYESWQNSAPGKKWETTRVSIISDLKKIDIPKAEASCFLDSVEELVIAGGTLGIGALAKSAYKTAKHFSAQIKGRNSGLPVIEDIYFKPPMSHLTTHRFAKGTPAEGYIKYCYARGAQNSIFIYLDFIQKGKVLNWDISSSHIQGHTPYSTSRAGINAIKEIGEKLGGNRIFLQFEPINLKFRGFVEKHYPAKGEYFHSFEDPFWGKAVCPVFELTSPCIGTTQKIVKLMTPFGVTETLRVLSSQSYIEPAHLSFSLTSPSIAYREVPEVTLHVAAALQTGVTVTEMALHASFYTGPEMALSIPDDTLSSLGQHILAFTGEVSGVRPALDELKRVNEIVQCLAKILRRRH